MDKIFEQALLYDFYGELLTPHQQTIYEDAVFHDMSLGEIAQEQGISRQGVHDLIKRCDKILQDYEKKLHLVERFSHAKEKIGEIVELTKDMENKDEPSSQNQAGKVTTTAEQEYGTEINQTGGKKQNLDMRIRRIRELSLELMKDW
ncbi:MAG: YlxM family DNA-binding protein [Bacteroidales bacterium]|nr:YlxM family DNA-binding protein [Bacteroidales bacterium]